MIDTLLYVFGPELAHRIFAKKEEITKEEFVEIIGEIVRKFEEAEESMDSIKKDIKTLSPVNLTSEFEAINKLLGKQRCWNYGILTFAAIVPTIAIILLVR